MLLVEDEGVTLDLLTIILSKKFPDLALHTAINGKMGLDIFKAYTPEIVVTDINMPEMDGVQMVENIGAIQPDTRFIIITGKSDKSLLQDTTAKRVEIDHFIVKPVVFLELFTAIEQCISVIGNFNQPA